MRNSRLGLRALHSRSWFQGLFNLASSFTLPGVTLGGILNLLCWSLPSEGALLPRPLVGRPPRLLVGKRFIGVWFRGLG